MAFDIERFPTSESALRMLDMVTEGFYDRSYVGKWLYQAIGLEYDSAKKLVEELPMQFFPETATWGLKYHEIKWGLPVRENLSHEERRKRICQHRDLKVSMTPYRMERYLENETGAKVQVADVNDPGKLGHTFTHPNAFRVTAVGRGIREEEIREAVDKMKQSHTVYAVECLEECYDVFQRTYMAAVPQSRKIYEVEAM